MEGIDDWRSDCDALERAAQERADRPLLEADDDWLSGEVYGTTSADVSIRLRLLERIAAEGWQLCPECKGRISEYACDRCNWSGYLYPDGRAPSDEDLARDWGDCK